MRDRKLPASSVRFQIQPPEKTTFAGAPAVSPDGRRIVFPSREQDGRVLLWVRSLDSLEAHPLPGTESPANPVFWSPDSRFIAFVSQRKLKKVEASGGPPLTLADVPGQWRGGSWGRNGVIVFSVGSGVWRVSAAGGAASPIIQPDAASPATHIYPVFLPDGRHFLYTLSSTGARTLPTTQSAGIYLGVLDAAPDGPNSKPLVVTTSAAGFAPPSDATGHLFFVRDTTLMAQPFDGGRLEPAGEAVPIAESIASTGPQEFSVSSNGVLAFRNASATEHSQITWFDRQGKPLGQVGPPAINVNVALSPDGKKAVVDRTDPQTRAAHLWIADLSRGVLSRLNPGDAADYAPAFSPDDRIAFTSTFQGALGDVYLKHASGAGVPELLVKSPTQKHPSHWSLDGRFVIYDDHHSTQRQDLWIVPVAGDRKPIPFLATAADEADGAFSPDGKLISYSSDESGRREVYVRDFAPDRVPAAGSGKWQISAAGGAKPKWRRDGKEIFYIAPDRMLMAVALKTAPIFQPGVAAPLFETSTTGFYPYDVTADGRRFLINAVPDPATLPSPPITVVLNWEAGLRK